MAELKSSVVRVIILQGIVTTAVCYYITIKEH